MPFRSVVSYFIDFQIVFPFSSVAAPRKCTRKGLVHKMRVNSSLEDFRESFAKLTQITLKVNLLTRTLSFFMHMTL